LSDALIGGGVTLVITVVLFPSPRYPSSTERPSRLLDLLGATVLSLAHASTTEFAADPPYSRALREAPAELTLAFAALAEDGDAGGSRAALHATRVRVILVTGAGQPADPRSELIARLVETCAGDTLRLARHCGQPSHSGQRKDAEGMGPAG
jgi:hypothetical protein